MENNQPLVSVIMNCYNSDKYLKEAIDSVLAQTYTNWEIIFWDNQSTDKSAEIVKSYDDERIKYFYAFTHTTLGEGRNKALERANGEFISFLDCDDLYLPQKLEKTLKGFKDKNIGLVYTNGYILFNEVNKKKVFYKMAQCSGNVYNNWVKDYKVFLPSVMFRKSLILGGNLKFDSRFSMIEEYDFFLKLSLISNVKYCKELLCIWRSHNESLTWRKKELFAYELELMYNDLKCLNLGFVQNELENIKYRFVAHKYINELCINNKNNRKMISEYIFSNKYLLVLNIISYLDVNYAKAVVKFLKKC